MFFPNGNSFDDYIAKKIVDEYRTMNGRPEQDAPVTQEVCGNILGWFERGYL